MKYLTAEEMGNMTEEDLAQVKEMIDAAIQEDRKQRRMEYLCVKIEDATDDNPAEANKQINLLVDEGWQIKHIESFGNNYRAFAVMERPIYLRTVA